MWDLNRSPYPMPTPFPGLPYLREGFPIHTREVKIMNTFVRFEEKLKREFSCFTWNLGFFRYK